MTKQRGLRGVWGAEREQALLEVGHLCSSRLRRAQGPESQSGLRLTVVSDWLPSFYDCKLRMMALGNFESHWREWK